MTRNVVILSLLLTFFLKSCDTMIYAVTYIRDLDGCTDSAIIDRNGINLTSRFESIGIVSNSVITSKNKSNSLFQVYSNLNEISSNSLISPKTRVTSQYIRTWTKYMLESFVSTLLEI